MSPEGAARDGENRLRMSRILCPWPSTGRRARLRPSRYAGPRSGTARPIAVRRHSSARSGRGSALRTRRVFKHSLSLVPYARWRAQAYGSDGASPYHFPHRDGRVTGLVWSNSFLSALAVYRQSVWSIDYKSGADAVPSPFWQPGNRAR
jgi:hypothetical protein